jgi:glutathione S-transferase
VIELYHHGSSVCAAKVRFALGEKALAWTGRYVDILKGDVGRAPPTATQPRRREPQ